MTLARPVRLSTLWLLACLLAVMPAAADVTIHCIDVGQGDATLIVSSSGQSLLFDAGYNGKGDGEVVPYLDALGIGQPTYIAASHYHADHIGGIDEVIGARGVTLAVYDRGWSYTTATYSDYVAAAGSKRQTLTDGQVIDLGDGVTVTCVALNGNGQLSPPYDDSGLENEYDVALLVECGDFDFLVAGDLTGGGGSYLDIESSVAAEVGEIEVYHVNHHGSYSSSNATFLAATLPEVSIISVGDGNPYGHPHQEVLDRLVGIGSYIYQTETGDPSSTTPAGTRTIVNGDIVISTTGYGTYTVNGDTWEMDEQNGTAAPALPAFALLGNVPNPFNPATSIRFTTDSGGPVRLTVYDLAGRLVLRRTLTVAPGTQAVRWDGRNDDGRGVPSGVYFYRVETRDGSGMGRMVLAR